MAATNVNKGEPVVDPSPWTPAQQAAITDLEGLVR